MPSPLGHALASTVLHKLKVPGPWKTDWKLLLFHVFCGISPDLDFIPGLLMGNMSRFHHTLSHGFPGAFLIAGFLWLFYAIWRKTWKIKEYFFIFLLVAIHPIMDVLALDASRAYGCPLLYPFLKEYWISPWVFFQDIHRESLFEFFLGANNRLAFWIEFAFFLPWVIVVTFPSRKKTLFYGLAGLFSLGVSIYYLRETKITDAGIEFVRVLGS
jgi:inner membrane protein